MKRFVAFFVLVALLGYGSNEARPQSKKDSTAKKTSDNKFPVPDFEIPMDLKAWKTNFIIQKITYNKDDNQIVFLVKAKKNFTFTDDGYDHPFEFIDEDGVSLSKEKNLKWEKEAKGLRMGEVTRVTLEVPDEDTLKKAKKCQAVVRGFFNKGK